LKLCEVIIKPMSAFGTLLKGDTLFGQFCWQAVYDSELLSGGLEKRLSEYHENPFAIFSSAVVKLSSGEYVLKRPDMPLTRLFDIENQECHEFLKQKKEKKKQVLYWLILVVELRILQ
jgi:CRISPR-associated protein Csm4